MANSFRFIPHTADVSFIAMGNNLPLLFDQASRALCSVISRDKTIKEKLSRKFQVKGKDREGLLYNFLEELIFMIDARQFVVARAEVEIERKNGEFTLRAKVFGDFTSNYTDLDHVKAATYADMYVAQKKNKTWEARVVLDV